jgi:cis-3-alkyl-4-acyloxetan-2-one decarboxylase
MAMERTAEFDRLYPFQGHKLAVDQEQMHYLDQGAGEPLLMLHGNPTWSFYYRTLVRDLQTRYRCVVPDHIGCGFSTKPRHCPYQLSQHILNVERLVEHLDLRNITLVVHDWGGAIGMGFASRQPDRIRRIVILNTAAFLSSRIPWRINICRLPGFGALVIRGFNGFAGPAVFMATSRRGGLPRDVARGYLLPYRSWGDRVANLRFVQDIPMGPKHPTYPVLAEIESRLELFRNTPMLICWGGRDFCFNDTFLRRWQAEFPRAAVHRFADAGHYVLEDAYERILPLVKTFLNSTG